MEGDERIRLFCALRLDPGVLDRVVEWQGRALADGMRGGGRIVSRESLHLTLAFLGSRPRGETTAIAAALREAVLPGSGGEALRFTLRRYRETRSVGMLVFDDEEGRGAALAGRLALGLEALGVYEPERRPWLPHLTVLRFRGPPGLRPALPDLGPVAPSDAAVYMSRLRPGGAQYEVLETVPLDLGPVGG